MPGALDDELAVLRARAYGPDADIQSDPQALARLRELEEHVARPSDQDGAEASGADPLVDWFGETAIVTGHTAGRRARRADAEAQAAAVPTETVWRTAASEHPERVAQPQHAEHPALSTSGQRGASPEHPVSPEPTAHPERLSSAGRDASADDDRLAQPGQVASAPSAAATPPPELSEPSGSAPTGPPASVAPPPEPPPAPVLSRRTRIGWVLSLVLAVVVTAGLTAWIFPFGVREVHHHDARLTLQGGEVSQSVSSQLGVARDDLRYWGEYLGAHIYGTDDCLLAYFPEESAQYGGGCAGHGLTPLMDLYVPGESDGDSYYSDTPFPEEMIRAFPEGGMVRFILQDDVVLVDVGEFPAAW